MRESIWVQIVKTLLLALSAFGYTYPLLQGSGHVIAVLAVVLASLMAGVFAKYRVRVIWCILASAIFILVGVVGSAMTLDVFGVGDVPTTIQVSRAWYFMGIIFGIVLMSRSLALRYQLAQLVEMSLVIGTLVYVFFAHRDFNLQNPREFADALYSRGYDPVTIYRYMGIAVAFLSVPMLLGKVRLGRFVYSMVALVIISLAVAWFAEEARIPINVKDPLGLKGDDENENGDGGDDQEDNSRSEDFDSDDDDSDSDDKNDGSKSSNESDDDKNKGGGGGGGGNGASNDPTPVAVAVFYDEYSPTDGIFHFRQEVLSEYNGNHLVASTVDDDVVTSLSTLEPSESTHIQAESMHTKVSTSMFLMRDHSQPPQIAMGQKIYAIQNPDPKIFVSAYAVESLGLTVDLSRLIGRRSIPMEWSSEKVEHYLQVPDDPRYKALSDIIVRQIEPAFIGDDMVKALYIKSWLEKNGYYTMKTKHINKNDPTASFLFGSLRGYCVHFAHSAVYLLRSQGIAARVAIGYAVDNQLRGTGSAVLILGNQAHAWPEIYVDGVGWVTFDIFPERGDEQPSTFADQSLESLFGELARDDKSGGKSEVPEDEVFVMPWDTVWWSILGLILLALIGCYVRKMILLIPGSCRRQEDVYRMLRAAVFHWNMVGHSWHSYDSLHEFSEKEAGADSALRKLVEYADAAKFGGTLSEAELSHAEKLVGKAKAEANEKTPVWRRILGYINPVVRL